eukprot:7830960-Lingulodinium_polyedra.AAC.1
MLPHLAAAITTSRAANWVAMPDDHDLLRFGRGVLPGDPWGDYVYSLTAAFVEGEIEQAADR